MALGCQTELPSMTQEDLGRSDEKTRFYTGFPNYATFMLMFSLFLKHGAAQLRYWEGIPFFSVANTIFHRIHVSCVSFPCQYNIELTLCIFLILVLVIYSYCDINYITNAHVYSI